MPEKCSNPKPCEIYFRLLFSDEVNHNDDPTSDPLKVFKWLSPKLNPGIVSQLQAWKSKLQHIQLSFQYCGCGIIPISFFEFSVQCTNHEGLLQTYHWALSGDHPKALWGINGGLISHPFRMPSGGTLRAFSDSLCAMEVKFTPRSRAR